MSNGKTTASLDYDFGPLERKIAQRMAANLHNIIVAWTRTELDRVSVWLDREVYVFEPSRSPDAAVSLRWLTDEHRRKPTEAHMERILGPKRGDSK